MIEWTVRFAFGLRCLHILIIFGSRCYEGGVDIEFPKFDIDIVDTIHYGRYDIFLNNGTGIQT